MKEFDFCIDEKVTVWNRLHYTVTAEDEEEARKLILKESETPEFSDNGNVKFNFCEMLYDTEEPMSVKENDNQTTKEIIDADGRIVWNNNGAEAHYIINKDGGNNE